MWCCYVERCIKTEGTGGYEMSGQLNPKGMDCLFYEFFKIFKKVKSSVGILGREMLQEVPDFHPQNPQDGYLVAGIFSESLEFVIDLLPMAMSAQVGEVQQLCGC